MSSCVLLIYIRVVRHRPGRGTRSCISLCGWSAEPVLLWVRHLLREANTHPPEPLAPPSHALRVRQLVCLQEHRIGCGRRARNR